MSFCTECGARFASSEAFCTQCGGARDTVPAASKVTVQDAPGVHQPTTPVRRRSSTLAWALGAFAVGLAVVLGAGLLLGAQGDSGAETASGPLADDTPARVSPTPTPVVSSAEPTATPTPEFPRPTSSAQPAAPIPDPSTQEPTPLAPQNEPGVQEALNLSETEAEGILLTDESPAVTSLQAGRWYPVLSSKCAGMGAYAELAQPLDLGSEGRIGMPDGRGESYSFLGSQRILALQRYYQWKFGPGVVNVTTQSLGRVKTYESLCGPYPMWITLNSSVSFNRPGAALDWCRANGFISGECGAYPVFMPEEVPRWI